MRQYTPLYIIFFLTLFLTSCNNESSKKIELISKAVDSMTIVKDISLNNLVTGFKSLDGQVVQTEGILYYEFENVAICAEYGTDSKCFWLDFNRELPTYDSLLSIFSGHRFIIKGTVDTSSKGHFGGYLATIRNVYYLKTK